MVRFPPSLIYLLGKVAQRAYIDVETSDLFNDVGVVLRAFAPRQIRRKFIHCSMDNFQQDVFHAANIVNDINDTYWAHTQLYTNQFERTCKDKVDSKQACSVWTMRCVRRHIHVTLDVLFLSHGYALNGTEFQPHNTCTPITTHKYSIHGRLRSESLQSVTWLRNYSWYFQIMLAFYMQPWITV